jgi:hypothetical protein
MPVLITRSACCLVSATLTSGHQTEAEDQMLISAPSVDCTSGLKGTNAIGLKGTNAIGLQDQMLLVSREQMLLVSREQMLVVPRSKLGHTTSYLIRCMSVSSGLVWPRSIAFLRAGVSLGICPLFLSTSSSTEDAVATMCCILTPNCSGMQATSVLPAITWPHIIACALLSHAHS